MKKFSIIILSSVLLLQTHTIPTYAQEAGAPTPYVPTEVDTGPSANDLIKISNLNYDASVNEGDIDVNVKPEFPAAYENVSIRLDSNTVDLNRYLIQWTVNDIPKLSGIGKRDFEVVSPGYGSVLKVAASIRLGPVTVQKNITIAPQDITVLWEAVDSYVPPFYKGKKMASQEALVKVSAIPNFQGPNKSLAINDAVYLWSRNGNRVLNVGGYAKDSLVIKHNRLRAAETISAEVSTVSGGTKAKKSVIIPIIDPQVHWYAKNLSGYRRLTSVDRGLRIKTGDIKLIAEPYFFSINSGPTELTLDWTMNGQQIYLDPNSSNQEILLRNPNERGQTNFALNVKNPSTFLQNASRALAVYFEAPAE